VLIAFCLVIHIHYRSQAGAVAADDFAKEIIGKLLVSHPPENIIGGTNSFVSYLRLIVCHNVH
jgi:hypothetical protein